MCRYVDCANGLIGDVEKKKSWHQHFSSSELSATLNNSKFQVLEIDGAGLFHRIFSIISLFLPGKSKHILSKVIVKDMELFSCCHLFCVAKKVE